eukprot:3658666-Rhodomonas_salina.1
MSHRQYKAVPGYRYLKYPVAGCVLPGYQGTATVKAARNSYEVCATTILQDSSNPPSMTTPFPLCLQQYPDRHSL